MVRVKIVGAGGYGGVGAIELLARHPNANIVSLSAIADYGKRISEYYPHLEGVCDLPVIHPDEDDVDADIAFFATPDGVGQRDAKNYLARGMKVIDYSGDFRFNTSDLYYEYAKRIGKDQPHASEDLLEETVYAIPELYRESIAKSRLAGNPGCFAVSAILGAYPSVKAGLIDTATLIFDAKTGVSGAGKKPQPTHHYPHRYEEMNAYKIGAHQHVMEIERELSLAAGHSVSVMFTPQVVPLTRGIMTTIYAKTRSGVTYADLLSVYVKAYQKEPFVRVYDAAKTVSNRSVRATNACALWVNLDTRTNTMVIASHIDNLLKGQAGNAVHTMNIMMGLPETEGLTLSGLYP